MVQQGICELFGVEFSAGVQIVPIQNGVEDEERAAICLPTPEWIGSQQQHVTVAGRHVDDGGALGDLIAVVQQAGNEEIAIVGVTKHDARTLIGWNEPNSVASLFVSDRRHLPWFYSRGRIGILDGRTALRLVQIVGRAATGGSRSRALTSADAIAETVDGTVHAVHRERITVAVGDRTVSVDGLRA